MQTMMKHIYRLYGQTYIYVISYIYIFYIYIYNECIMIITYFTKQFSAFSSMSSNAQTKNMLSESISLNVLSKKIEVYTLRIIYVLL